MGANRRAGAYSPSDGFILPSEAFTGTPDVPCPEVGDEARSWWATWATSPYAHFFGAVEWQDLADTARLMEGFYVQGNARHYAEARQHINGLFGLATRARLHISEARPEADVSEVARKPRQDPRLRSA